MKTYFEIINQGFIMPEEYNKLNFEQQLRYERLIEDFQIDRLQAGLKQ